MLEIRKYQIANFPSFITPEKTFRLDEWWSLVFLTGDYPSLSKLMKAILCCFHGPVVENSFSSMNYILDKRSGRMDIKTYSAIQTVRTSLKSNGTSSLNYFHRDNIHRDPIKSALCKNMQTSSKRYREENLKHVQRERKSTKTDGQNSIKVSEGTALKTFVEDKRKLNKKYKASIQNSSKRPRSTKPNKETAIQSEPMSKKPKLTLKPNLVPRSIKTTKENAIQSEPMSKKPKLTPKSYLEKPKSIKASKKSAIESEPMSKIPGSTSKPDLESAANATSSQLPTKHSVVERQKEDWKKFFQAIKKQ
ncbi:hypothetical protein JTE90_019557 [Oedothorax gibbosus]|uniref:HAT C-terminal dimerisation domain-containing protein n=1 Tax=Oedothorax gibbosus TaxID=931172 RepID=A0AAV6V6Z3_9ARAC|nr:hypothetical protein JTE90_019557 [Oedothorax gibbosus]